MHKTLVTAMIVAAMLPALQASAQTPSTAQAAPMAPAGPGLPAVRHLEYRFGYNTPATKAGTGTGTTTIDITGLAPDGGMTITATDNWWNTVRPRQTYTCEVYANGGVVCPQPPYALSPIQVAIVPLLGRRYFAALAGNAHATWEQKYSVRATFFPSGTHGFSGHVYTWNGVYSLTAKGTTPNNGEAVNVIHSTGSMTQQGGRAVKVNQKANLLFDPRLKIPVYVDELFTFVPRLSVNQYTIQMKLIHT